jgi:hypothetical protein
VQPYYSSGNGHQQLDDGHNDGSARKQVGGYPNFVAMAGTRVPTQLLAAWSSSASARPTGGRPAQNIRHGYVTALENLDFESETEELWEWMVKARDGAAESSLETYLPDPS